MNASVHPLHKSNFFSKYFTFASNILKMKKAINVPGAPKAIGPYSQAILTNGMLFVSGQIPIDPSTGELLKGDIQEQTHRVMANILAILKDVEMDFSNVVKASIFLSDMENFQKVNEAYATYFSETPPARECIQAARLPRSVDIEISVIAVKE
jgi:2-iminobutanoate/2-iminopropanoate deaminase